MYYCMISLYLSLFSSSSSLLKGVMYSSGTINNPSQTNQIESLRSEHLLVFSQLIGL